MTAVNEDNALLGKDNSCIGIEILPDIDINPVFDFLTCGPRSCADRLPRLPNRGKSRPKNANVVLFSCFSFRAP